MKKIIVTLFSQGGGGGGMGGGMGSMVAGIVQGVTGIGQMIGGSVKVAKAKKLMPDEVDQSQVSQLDTLRRLRLGYQTGSEASSYNKTINTGTSNVVNAATQNSGGNMGALMSVLNGAQTGASTAYGNVAANLEKNRMGALAMEDQAVDNIAQRRLDIRMAKYLQAMGEGTSLQKAGAQNFGASFNTFSGGTTSGDVTGGGDPSGGVSDKSVKKQQPSQSGNVSGGGTGKDNKSTIFSGAGGGTGAMGGGGANF